MFVMMFVMPMMIPMIMVMSISVVMIIMFGINTLLNILMNNIVLVLNAFFKVQRPSVTIMVVIMMIMGSFVMPMYFVSMMCGSMTVASYG